MTDLVPQRYERAVKLDRLTEHPRNPRQGDVGEISQSIAANGFYGAVIAQTSTGQVLAGNHRLKAARTMGLSTLPVVWVDVDDDTALRILLADNRTSDLASYDDNALADLLRELAADDPAKLDGTGYDGDALDQLLSDLEDSGPPTESSLLKLADVSIDEPDIEVHRGEVWRMGKHRLVIADPLHEWSQVFAVLEPGNLLVMYGGPYITASIKADSSPFVIVHSDLYIAGHVLVKWNSLHPDNPAEKVA